MEDRDVVFSRLLQFYSSFQAGDCNAKGDKGKYLDRSKKKYNLLDLGRDEVTAMFCDYPNSFSIDPNSDVWMETRVTEGGKKHTAFLDVGVYSGLSGMSNTIEKFSQELIIESRD